MDDADAVGDADGDALRQDSLHQVDIPSDAYFETERNWLIVNLRSDWEVAGQRYRAGALLVTGFDALLAEPKLLSPELYETAEVFFG